jgi:hypothetical protein
MLNTNTSSPGGARQASKSTPIAEMDRAIKVAGATFRKNGATETRAPNNDIGASRNNPVTATNLTADPSAQGESTATTASTATVEKAHILCKL